MAPIALLSPPRQMSRTFSHQVQNMIPAMQRTARAKATPGAIEAPAVSRIQPPPMSTPMMPIAITPP
jgi:hypothetical protein